MGAAMFPPSLGPVHSALIQPKVTFPPIAVYTSRLIFPEPGDSESRKGEFGLHFLGGLVWQAGIWRSI